MGSLHEHLCQHLPRCYFRFASSCKEDAALLEGLKPFGSDASTMNLPPLRRASDFLGYFASLDHFSCILQFSFAPLYGSEIDFKPYPFRTDSK